MNTIYKYISGDRAIWLVMILLGIASLLLVYSSIVTLAYQYHQGNTVYYLFRHGGFVLSGLLLIYIIHNVNYIYFSRIAQLALWISVPLLIITLVMGTNINEASRWL
ncbi:MAG: FtsW/RodA/SpoVE family cell cycle protein, partial [Flavobacteriales bacterium]